MKKSHTNRSITIVGDGLRSGVEQEQGFVGARQRRQQLLEQELKEQKRVLEIARRSNIYWEATVREQVRVLTVQLEEVRGQ